MVSPSSPEPEPQHAATRRVAWNTVAWMGARFVDAAFALVYLRLLDRADVGQYQFLVVFTTYVDTLVDFGLNTVVARDLPRARGAALAALRTVSLLRLGLWVVGLPLVATVYGPAHGVLQLSDEATIAGWLFYLGLLPTVLAKTASGVLWSFERLDLPAAVSVVATLLKTALGAIVLIVGLGMIGLAGTSLVINLVTAAALLVFVRATLARAPHSRELHPIAWLREAWPLFINQLLQGLFFRIDAALLPALAGPAVAGTYAAAYKVCEGAGIASSSFTLALFPRLARTNDLSAASRLALRILLQLAVPLAAGTALLAAPIVGLVGGTNYLPDSAIALAVLIWFLPLSYANGLTQYVLIASGRQRFLTGAFIVAFAFNVGANVLLIPQYGYVGAALVTIASEVVLMIPFQWAASRVAPGVSPWVEARVPVMATLLMAPVVWWARDSIGPLPAIPIGVVIYIAALWSLGGIDERQRSLLAELSPAPLRQFLLTKL
jgi:O-antigen/teichoic acid export membrane protein